MYLHHITSPVRNNHIDFPLNKKNKNLDDVPTLSIIFEIDSISLYSEQDRFKFSQCWSVMCSWSSVSFSFPQVLTKCLPTLQSLERLFHRFNQSFLFHHACNYIIIFSFQQGNCLLHISSNTKIQKIISSETCLNYLYSHNSFTDNLPVFFSIKDVFFSFCLKAKIPF